jgi:DNA polymerase-3 subunit delta'
MKVSASSPDIPMLSEIIGQPYAVQILRNALSEDRVSGSFLFIGPPRTGKATAAREFARAALCEDPQPGPDSCGVCFSCRAIEHGKHPDVRAVQPAGPSRILRMPQIWPRDGVRDFPPESALLHDMHFAPVRGKRRIFIIEEADALNDDTANSILKVLEEPPPYAVFILTAPEADSVLPTIFSRCQTVRFRALPAAQIEQALVSRMLASDKEAAFLAAMSQGRIGQAMEMASDHSLRTARETVLLIAEQLSTTRLPIHALKLADDLRKAGSKLASAKKDGDAEGGSRQASVAVLEILAHWHQDLLALSSGSAEGALINRDHAQTLSAIAVGLSSATILAALDLILTVRDFVERNANGQIAFEALALRLAQLNAPSSHAKLYESVQQP